ncbi:MAG: glycosyl hydrolase [Fluviicola sp. XM-24bin1]|nr:MAG: glycosyl hydrolase [Fluviicola sp. XM-24bin1]
MRQFILLLLFSLGSLTGFSQSLDTVFQTTKFRSIGPFRGGRSVAVSGVKGDPLTYYMGSTGGGAWKTTDGGLNWTNISDGYFEMGSVGAIAVSESNTNIVYCGMGEHAPRGVMTSYGDGVYKSTNGGKTWKHIGLTETQHISRIQIHPTNPDIVFVAAQGNLYGPNEERGIFKSIDGGKTWNKVLYVNNLTGCSELSMDMKDPEVIYASMWEHQRLPWKIVSGGDGSGLYKSEDGGETWNKMEDGVPEEMGKSAISVSRANSDRVYALIEADREKKESGLYVSNDAGKSWDMVSSEHKLTQRSWYYTEVFADPNNEDLVYVLSARAYRSKNGGRSWGGVYANHGDYHDMWINPDNSENFAIANDGGAQVSLNDGGSWSDISGVPIAQIYRINTDNLDPYRIYSGQQDYPSFRIKSANIPGWQITENNIQNAAGGESAFLAFNPDNPRYVMGGSYQGTIEYLDMDTKTGVDIMAAPIQYLGKDAKDMKYRFNWNAPIICSVHDPNVFYHASQILLKTTDKGITWTEVSPDLTRNQKDKQGKPGGPFTNEAVGAETYGSISYVVESSKNEGELWVATDDGLVQLSKDGGATWKNITPKGLKECLVNAVELSAHQEGVAYIATTRYKFNDHTPGLYKTENYGKTWKLISNGIPDGAYTRVVREDPNRKGLLLAGTEKGIYISFNDGVNWERFQLNLPDVPINDIRMDHDDIQVGTSGRGLWIFDDLHLLREYNATKKTAMYVDESFTLGSWGSPLDDTDVDFSGAMSSGGVNPAYGAVIYYSLPELADSVKVELVIKDASGNTIRTFGTNGDPSHVGYPSGPSAPPTIDKEEGLNRFVWDLNHKGLVGAPRVYIEGGYRGRTVMPGEYTAVLKVGNETLEKKFSVLKNPKLDISDDAFVSYDAFLKEMEATVNDMHTKVNSLNKIKGQINAIMGDLKGDEFAEVRKAGQELVKRLNSFDTTMVQRMNKAYDDVENFENKLSAEMLFVLSQSRNQMRRINASSRERFEEILKQWLPLKEEAETLLNTEIPAFNKLLWEVGVGAIRK